MWFFPGSTAIRPAHSLLPSRGSWFEAKCFRLHSNLVSCLSYPQLLKCFFLFIDDYTPSASLFVHTTPPLGSCLNIPPPNTYFLT